MVLSIGMIVKNEEKYLEQCLTALKPILDAVDSELIIADTGSTDNTVEIARKFTDDVYHFEWINDFAAARNSTLKKAQGAWYMFIDADEILQDCSDIIKFFKSGEYKKYNSATYIVRSYADLSDKETYSDIRSQRLVAVSSGTEFVGKIHEAFDAFSTPIKYLNLIADHYGYVFLDNGVDTGAAKEKNQRNLEYLFEELKDDRIAERNPSIYSEISDCYGIINDEAKELEYLNLGLEKVDHKNIAIGQYYTHKIIIFYRNEQFKKVIATANEYFDINKHPWHNKELASDCYVLFTRAYSYYKLKEYRSAITDITKFFDLYKKYTQNKLNTEDLMFDLFRVDTAMVRAGYDFFFRCCYQEKMFALADDYTGAIPLKDYFDDPTFMHNHLVIRVEIMANVGFNKFDTLYWQLNAAWKDRLLMLVRPKVFKAAPQKRGIIIKKLASLGGTSSDLAQIYRGYFENNHVNYDLVKSFLEKYGSENGEDMLLILMVQNLDITPFVCARDFFADRAVQLSLVNYEAPMTVFENYDITAISDEGLVPSASLYGWIMLRAIDKNLKIARVFEKYGELGVRWYDEFQSNKMTGDIRAALLVNKVADAHSKRDLALFRKCIEEVKNIVPDLIPVVNAYRNEVEDDFFNVSSEFAQLAIQVKQNIRDLIASRNIDEARKLIKEFEEICPNDSDIDALKVELNNALQ